MTEGIIQQVFTKWKKYSNTKQCTQDIIDIEKELIEKIKQADRECSANLVGIRTLHTHKSLTKMLIGDTQQ